MNTHEPNLFGFVADHGAYHEPLRARAIDPLTSHAAAARHRSSGRLESLKARGKVAHGE